jgi:hypothetical protein
MLDYSFTKKLDTDPNAGYSEGFDNSPLPPGAYSFVIEKASEAPCIGSSPSMKPETVQAHLADTGSEPGFALKIQAKIVEGDFAGRKVFWGKNEFLMVAPSDETTQSGKTASGREWKLDPPAKVAIGVENLEGLLRSCGIGSIGEVTDLIGLAGTVRAEVSKCGKYNRFNFRPSKPSKGEVVKKIVVGTAPVAASVDEPPF